MNPLDQDILHHQHPHRPYWKRAHRDWKFWIVALFLLALMVFYVMSDNFALRGRGQQVQPVHSGMPAVAP